MFVHSYFEFLILCFVVCVFFFFFFKQKTAYEMRISDWSSDVCSSDLADAGARGTIALGDRTWRSRRRKALRLLPEQRDGGDAGTTGCEGGPAGSKHDRPGAAGRGPSVGRGASAVPRAGAFAASPRRRADRGGCKGRSADREGDEIGR